MASPNLWVDWVLSMAAASHSSHLLQEDFMANRTGLSPLAQLAGFSVKLAMFCERAGGPDIDILVLTSHVLLDPPLAEC